MASLTHMLRPDEPPRPPQEPAAPRPAARRRAMLWLLTTAIVAGLVVALATVGGFDDVSDRDIATISVGERSEGAELSVTVQDARLSAVRPGTTIPADEGALFLTVAATLENSSDAPIITNIDGAVRITIDGAIPPTTLADSVTDARTGAAAIAVQPGVPAEVLYEWEVPTSALSSQDALLVTLVQRDRTRDDVVFGEAYGAPYAVARLSVPITAADAVASTQVGGEA